MTADEIVIQDHVSIAYECLSPFIRSTVRSEKTVFSPFLPPDRTEFPSFPCTLIIEEFLWNTDHWIDEINIIIFIFFFIRSSFPLNISDLSLLEEANRGPQDDYVSGILIDMHVVIRTRG